MARLFKPEVFQGSLRKKHYFEGWYFKHVSKDNSQVFSFIPGISLSKEDPHAFIQVINGTTGDTHYLTYPKKEFKWKKRRFFVNVGGSIFTDKYIDLNIDQNNLTIQGRLIYSDTTQYPKTLLSPGIMGWYSYVPFMECYHGVVSANHTVDGVIQINSEQFKFAEGKGYIEKDWGTSFPECWIWLQSNSFSYNNSSLFISIAKIPWMKKYFIGFIAFICIDGKYYKFATYNGSKMGKVERDGSNLAIELYNKKYKLIAKASTNNSGELKAPKKGSMSRRIKESIDSDVQVQLISKSGKVIFEDESMRAGLEVIEELFNYL